VEQVGGFEKTALQNKCREKFLPITYCPVNTKRDKNKENRQQEPFIGLSMEQDYVENTDKARRNFWRLCARL
jgi:hypothetical protein